MTFQERLQKAFAEEAERRASVGEPRLTKTDLWKAADASSAAATHWFNGANGMDLATCVKVAPILRVNARWLYDGSGSKHPNSAPSTIEERADRPWPFPSIPESEIRALQPSHLSALEGAIALAIAQLKIGIRVAVPQRDHRRAGGVAADMNAVADPFPQAPVEPMPWEPGGKTLQQLEREQAAARRQVIAANEVDGNVAPGEPHPSSDKFEKVPELADVRLAAGDGIENHSEEQTGVVQFRKTFLRSVGADPKTARVVYAKGDSMEPVIRDGAALLVVPNENLTMRDITAGGIYAINYGGKMLVKTLIEDSRTKRWVARSLNPAYPDIMLDDSVQVRVLGPIVWCGTRLT